MFEVIRRWWNNDQVFFIPMDPPSEFKIGLIGNVAAGKTCFIASAMYFERKEATIDPYGDGGLYTQSAGEPAEHQMTTRSWFEEYATKAIQQGKFPPGTHKGQYARWRMRAYGQVGEVRDYPGVLAIDNQQDVSELKDIFYDVDAVLLMIPIDRTPFFRERVVSYQNKRAVEFRRQHQHLSETLKYEYKKLRADLLKTLQEIKKFNPKALVYFVITQADFAEGVLEEKIQLQDVYHSLHGLEYLHHSFFYLCSSFLSESSESMQSKGKLTMAIPPRYYDLPAEIITKTVRRIKMDKKLTHDHQVQEVVKLLLKTAVGKVIAGPLGL